MGYKTVSYADRKVIVEKVKKQVGGIYDAATGEVIEEKRKLLLSTINNEYKAKHPEVDAIVYIATLPEKKRYSGEKIRFYNVVENMSGQTGLSNWWNKPKGFYGDVAVIVTKVKFKDADGDVEYFESAGGIQLLQNLTRKGVFTDVSKDKLMANELIISQSIDYALKQLIALHAKNKKQ